MTNAPSHLSERQANDAYDVLIAEAGANGGDRDAFVRYFASPSTIYEWRFIGTLGFGGKIHWSAWRGLHVSCYPEDATPERKDTIDRVDALLVEIDAGDEVRLRGLSA